MNYFFATLMILFILARGHVDPHAQCPSIATDLSIKLLPTCINGTAEWDVGWRVKWEKLTLQMKSLKVGDLNTICSNVAKWSIANYAVDLLKISTISS